MIARINRMALFAIFALLLGFFISSTGCRGEDDNTVDDDDSAAAVDDDDSAGA
jgi:hypothetical protein